VLARIVAAVLGVILALLFLVLMILSPPTETHHAALVVGAIAGVSLYFARTGSPRPWRAALFLPGLYLVQVPAIYFALQHFPHHRSIHCLFSLAASALLFLAVIGYRRWASAQRRSELAA